jgi:hypothetical protein
MTTPGALIWGLLTLLACGLIGLSVFRLRGTLQELEASLRVVSDLRFQLARVGDITEGLQAEIDLRDARIAVLEIDVKRSRGEVL